MHSFNLLPAGLLLLQAASAIPHYENPTPYYGSPSKPSQPICGLVGYDDHARHIVSQRQCSTPAQCATLCQKSSRCKSYGYGKKVCRLYSKSVAQNVTRNKRSPYIFYDKKCPMKPGRSTTKKPITTTKKSTTSVLTTRSTLQTSSTSTSTSISATASTGSSTGSSTPSSTILTTASTTQTVTTSASVSTTQTTTTSDGLITTATSTADSTTTSDVSTSTTTASVCLNNPDTCVNDSDCCSGTCQGVVPVGPCFGPCGGLGRTCSPTAVTSTTTSIASTTTSVASSTTSVDSTTTTTASTTTTTAGLACGTTTTLAAGTIPTGSNVVMNPGFENRNNGGFADDWTGIAANEGPSRSGSGTAELRAVQNFLIPTMGSSITQTISNLDTDATYALAYYFRPNFVVPGTATCELTVTLGGVTIDSQRITSSPAAYQGPVGSAIKPCASQQDLTFTWGCSGDTYLVVVNLDDVSLAAM